MPQTPVPAASRWGQNREERAALLGVGTGPKALRAVGGSFLKLWDSKEKLTVPNTLPAVHKAEGLRDSGEELAHTCWRWGGGGEGKGADSATGRPPPPTLQTGPRFLFEDFLRPDRQHPLGPRREKASHTRGECAQAPGCLNR